MIQTPPEAQVHPQVTVGLYHWRIPRSLRTCYESVAGVGCACLVSPFSSEDPREVTPDTLHEELYLSLTAAEPTWAVGVAPVWPHLGGNMLTFVPVPGCRSLVCLLVVATEWRYTVLVPRRSDVPWLLGHLRRREPGSIVAIRAPVAASKFDSSSEEAADWRTGDVILAFDSGDTHATYEAPSFDEVSAVRHSAIWSHDFQVQCTLPLVIWRPGRPCVRAEMPGPSRWLAASQHFDGRFHTKYPGRWTPVPWAYNADVHLCLRAEDPLMCNVVLETISHSSGAPRLEGHCVTVPSYTTCASIAGQLQRPLELVSVLGIDAELEGDVPLRMVMWSTAGILWKSARPL